MSRQVTGRTGLLCLLGSPVAHSISPAMHIEACALLDLDYTYLAFDVAPDRLAEAVEGLKALGVRGCNVTMPHKTAAAALCERLSPAARICGAVNTVVNEGGSLVGHTTDGEGYMRSAREAGFQPEGKRMVQLGAGGGGPPRRCRVQRQSRSRAYGRNRASGRGRNPACGRGRASGRGGCPLRPQP